MMAQSNRQSAAERDYWRREFDILKGVCEKTSTASGFVDKRPGYRQN
jgi:hypothetical protein